MDTINHHIGQLLIGLIKAYRFLLSPFFGNRCRFYPSCSQYAAQAVQKHGPWKGLLLTLRRLLRCQPLHPGGNDPVP